MMPGTDLQNVSDFIFGTHQRWLAKDAWAWIIELKKKDFYASDLIFGDRKRIQFTSGKYATITVHLGKDNNAQWSLPYETLNRNQTEGLTEGDVYLRYLNNHSLLSQHEVDQNEGGKEQIVPLATLKREEMNAGAAEELETAFFSPNGNHDATKKMLGIRHLITADGLHFTGSGSVQGIDPAVETRWQNQFINPAAASADTGGVPISNFSQLRKAMNRMARAVRWQRPKLGNLAHVMDDGRPTKQMAAKEKYDILVDDKTFFEWEDMSYGRRDDMSRDQHGGMPLFLGWSIQPNENLGVPAAGMHADSNRAGLWGGGGEALFINRDELKMVVHKKHSPHVYKPKDHQDMHAKIHDMDIWLQPGVRSRRREGTIVGYQF